MVWAGVRPPSVSAFLRAAHQSVATAADLCGARVLRVTEERSELRLVTGHGVPILCHRPSGHLVPALIDRNIVRVRVWDTKKTRLCVPVPRIITGPRGDSPLAGSDHD